MEQIISFTFYTNKIYETLKLLFSFFFQSLISVTMGFKIIKILTISQSFSIIFSRPYLEDGGAKTY